LITVKGWSVICIGLTLTACTPKPPAYESREASPPSSISNPVQPKGVTTDSLPATASFIDEFERANTTSGLGDGWDMRGAPTDDDSPPPPATDGYIKDDHFTYAGTSDVYAIRQLRAAVTLIGAEGQFRRSKAAGGVTAISMGTAGDGNLETDLVMFSASRTFRDLKVKLAKGGLETIATGQFAPPLGLDRNYQFTLQRAGNTVSVTGPGINVTKSLAAPIALGTYGFWREYPSRTPAGEFFDYDKVWAVEDGQPAVPAAAPASGGER